MNEFHGASRFFVDSILLYETETSLIIRKNILFKKYIHLHTAKYLLLKIAEEYELSNLQFSSESAF